MATAACVQDQQWPLQTDSGIANTWCVYSQRLKRTVVVITFKFNAENELQSWRNLAEIYCIARHDTIQVNLDQSVVQRLFGFLLSNRPHGVWHDSLKI